MLLPLYLVEKDDGIPLPESSFYLQGTEMELSFLDDEEDRVFVIGITQAQPEPEESTTVVQKLVYPIGVCVRVKGIDHTVLKNPDGQELPAKFLEVEVIRRAKLEMSSIRQTTGGYMLANIVELDLETEFTEEYEDLNQQLIQLEGMLEQNPNIYKEPLGPLIAVETAPLKKLDKLATIVLVTPELRLAYLQSQNHYERYNAVLDNIAAKIRQSRKNPGHKKRNKKKESSESQSLEDRIKHCKAPRSVKKVLIRELDRLNNLNKASAEHASLQEYLTWGVDLPWGKYSHNKVDLHALVNLLDESHHGLEDVKEHILEHMTIEKLTGGSTGMVLCFVGPPGTGKTSIGAQIAKATGRPLRRIALGSLADEAEIRGHRRTYVAARPGRFILGLKEAGTMDPLFLLDEIDKISSYKGDPTAALLEVLDPEQNHAFIDRYLEYSIDISSAMFICTANYKDQIPPALLDRMEFIYFKAYEYEERQEILRRFIVPKSIAKYKMQDLEIEFTEAALDEIAKEPQVRQIEKKVQKLLRRAAVKVVVHGNTQVSINLDFLHEKQDNSETTYTPIGFK